MIFYRKFFYLIILMFLLKSPVVAAQSFIHGFDYPVGWPNASGYYDAQDFGEWNSAFKGYHLGEDWNKTCGGDCDLGEPLYSISEGIVTLVANRRGWGNVVIITYEDRITALYAHLKDVDVRQGQNALRGDKIGTIGKGDRNQFWAHLHFEIRDNISIGIGSGYGAYKPNGWLDPSEFIKANRPKPPVVASTLEGEVKNNKANLSWSESASEEFLKYEIYRAEEEGGTKNPEKRTLVDSLEDRSTTTIIDPFNLVAKKDYYYAIATFEKDGRSATSNEIKLIRNHEIINITNHPHTQTSPRVQGRYIVWRDYRYEQTSFPTSKTLYYYDLEAREAKTTQIGNVLNRLQGPYGPDVYGDLVCYHAKDSSYADNEIYCHNLKTGYDLPITNNNDYDHDPKISSAGYVVWTKAVSNRHKIYALNLNNAAGEYLVIDAPYNQSQPSIDGSILVWKDTRSGNRTDIYMKDLAGGEEVLLATNTGGGAAEISGDYVTWANKGIAYLLNIKTKEQIVIEASDVRVVEIDGGKVAYFKYEGGSLGNIYIYEIATGSHTKIDYPLYWVPNMDIFEDVLVFSAPGPDEKLESYMDIHLTYL
jgi:beta propeller repeat protein